jgi:HD-like signal output (HDOD) protein
METTPSLNDATYLGAALPDLHAWVRYLQDTEIPVLARTAQALEQLREREEAVNAAELGELILTDPLMTVKFLAYAATRRRQAESTDTETVTSSLVMTGITPFFAYFGVQPTVEEHLATCPQALERLYALLGRAERAAHFALAFAVHRSDTDAPVIYEAAFLHEFVDMLICCHAPTLAIAMQQAQEADPTLRSAAVQRAILNIELDDLRQALFKLWHLPELLVRVSDSHHAVHSSVQSVWLACRVARHTAIGWDNAALPDDIEDLSKLLNASPRVTLAFLHKVDLAHQSSPALALPLGSDPTSTVS